jgi:hypothetical protein
MVILMYTEAIWFDAQASLEENMSLLKAYEQEQMAVLEVSSFAELPAETKVEWNTWYDDLSSDIVLEKFQSEQLAKKKADFYDAREVARAEVVAEQMALMSAFDTLWQSKEDNDFDVDYMPSEGQTPVMP